MLNKSTLVLAAGLGLFATIAIPLHAYADSCTATAAGKKLAGAAMTSFMKKCQTDAATSCDTQAAGKKLAGSAKTSFTKKCVSVAVGS